MPPKVCGYVRASPTVGVGVVAPRGRPAVRHGFVRGVDQFQMTMTKVGIEVPGVTKPECSVDGDGDGLDNEPPSWMSLRSPLKKHITVLALTTDAAGDQAAAIRYMAAMTAGDEQTCVLGVFCAMHQVHLVVGRQLKRAGGGRYVNQLAVLVNLWRSPPNPPRVRQDFQDLYSEDMARHVASTPPPAPIRGRWGAVDDCEQHLLRTTQEQLLAVSRS